MPILLNVKNGQPYYPPKQLASASGEVSLLEGGVVRITKTGSLAAMTLADPIRDAVDSPVYLTIVVDTTFAHKLTYTSGFGGGANTIATFSTAGETLMLVSSNGLWNIVAFNGAVFS